MLPAGITIVENGEAACGDRVRIFGDACAARADIAHLRSAILRVVVGLKLQRVPVVAARFRRATRLSSHCAKLASAGCSHDLRSISASAISFSFGFDKINSSQSRRSPAATGRSRSARHRTSRNSTGPVTSSAHLRTRQRAALQVILVTLGRHICGRLDFGEAGRDCVDRHLMRAEFACERARHRDHWRPCSPHRRAASARPHRCVRCDVHDAAATRVAQIRQRGA